MSSPTLSSSFTLHATLFFFLAMAQGGLGTTFTVVNRCDHTVWPGILSSAGTSDLGSTGFQLQPGSTRILQVQPGWSGRFWARTACSFDPATGQGTCATGDCGSNTIECTGAGAIPPATLAEFTIGSGGAQDFYDVSLVDGYNLPVMVEASGGSGACGSTGCAADLNRLCPTELRTEDGRACRSACEAFRGDEYCCSGAYASPATCRPSVYSEFFKNACPRSYSYAYDDATSTFTCTAADYTITFCPKVTSQKSAEDSSSPVTAGNTDGVAPPAAAVNTADQPPENYYHPPGGWLPNFAISGSSHFDLIHHFIISEAIIIFSSFIFSHLGQ